MLLRVLIYLSVTCIFLFGCTNSNVNVVNVNDFVIDTVSITRNGLYVPFIEAKTQQDYLFSLGYIFGQDKALTISKISIAINAHLSTTYGEKYLYHDLFVSSFQDDNYDFDFDNIDIFLQGLNYRNDLISKNNLIKYLKLQDFISKVDIQRDLFLSVHKNNMDKQKFNYLCNFYSLDPNDIIPLDDIKLNFIYNDSLFINRQSTLTLTDSLFERTYISKIELYPVNDMFYEIPSPIPLEVNSNTPNYSIKLDVISKSEFEKIRYKKTINIKGKSEYPLLIAKGYPLILNDLYQEVENDSIKIVYVDIPNKPINKKSNLTTDKIRFLLKKYIPTINDDEVSSFYNVLISTADKNPEYFDKYLSKFLFKMFEETFISDSIIYDFYRYRQLDATYITLDESNPYTNNYEETILKSLYYSAKNKKDIIYPESQLIINRGFPENGYLIQSYLNDDKTSYYYDNLYKIYNNQIFIDIFEKEPSSSKLLLIR